MKKNKFLKLIIALLFLSPLHLFAQQNLTDITGLWKGQLYDDTTKQYIYYELAISDDNGKLGGYSYSVFKGDSADEMGLKTIKIKRKDDKIIIEDINLIADSYSIAPAKKVKKILILTLTVKDSIMVMSGKWATNWTREYHPVTGTVEVKRKNDNWKDEPLVKKLDEMKLSNTLSFNPPQKTEEPVAVKQQETLPPAVAEKVITDKPVRKIKKPLPVVVTSPITDSSATAAVIKPAKKVKAKEKTVVAVAKDSTKATVITKPVPVVVPPPAAEAAIRKTEVTQTIDYESDSLVFTIYDNGIVDGDTVSIVMNNHLIFAKAGLSEQPNTKTFYMKDNPDSVQLIWYAENLGSIPPNTGLLIIMDGKIRHEVFFSADLQTNAAIILRRKKKIS